MVERVIRAGIRRTSVLIVSALTLGVWAGNVMASDNSSTSVKDGRKVYNETCVACHGTDGKGEVPGAPDLTRKDGRLSKSDEALLDHIKNGFRSPGSPMGMPPKGGNPDLSDQDVKDVIEYMHKTLHIGWREK